MVGCSWKMVNFIVANKEYYVKVYRVFGISVEADTEDEALEYAYEHAEEYNCGIADDYWGEIVKVTEVEDHE